MSFNKNYYVGSVISEENYSGVHSFDSRLTAVSDADLGLKNE